MMIGISGSITNTTIISNAMIGSCGTDHAAADLDHCDDDHRHAGRLYP
jgi:hypothetical protein